MTDGMDDETRAAAIAAMEAAWQQAQRDDSWHSYDDTINGLLDAVLPILDRRGAPWVLAVSNPNPSAVRFEVNRAIAENEWPWGGDGSIAVAKALLHLVELTERERDIARNHILDGRYEQVAWMPPTPHAEQQTWVECIRVNRAPHPPDFVPVFVRLP